MDLLERIYGYEPALVAMIADKMPEDPEIWRQVYGQKDLEALINQMAFSLFILANARGERECACTLGYFFNIDARRASAFLKEVSRGNKSRAHTRK